MRNNHVAGLCGLLVLSALTMAPCEAIEAVRGKNYALTREHGPWMVMVASFRNVPEERRQEGLSAEEAALELVYELRQKGIPAYTHSQPAVVEKIETIDRQGRDDERIYAAQRDMVCVLAGNWKDIQDSESQKTLKWIKSYQPKFMKQEKSGAIYRVTPGQKGPLGGAFMTINPMLSPEEVARRKPDPLVAQLNHGSMYPLIGCKRKYTVQVATFTGKKVNSLGDSAMKWAAMNFDKKIGDTKGLSLNDAGEEAEQLVIELRKRNHEAYVHHDRFQSIVTVGAFDSPSDPRVRRTIHDFGAKVATDKTTGADVIVAENLILGNNADGTTPAHAWVFDPQPQVIEVPRLK